MDAVFKAIAHPARRRIISLLSESDCSVKTLTAAFAMTQPAVSQHLRELREAELVTSSKVGMEQMYKLTGQPLAAVFEWSSSYKRFFDPAGHAWAFLDQRPDQRQDQRTDKKQVQRQAKRQKLTGSEAKHGR